MRLIFYIIFCMETNIEMWESIIWVNSDLYHTGLQQTIFIWQPAFDYHQSSRLYKHQINRYESYVSYNILYENNYRNWDIFPYKYFNTVLNLENIRNSCDTNKDQITSLILVLDITKYTELFSFYRLHCEIAFLHYPDQNKVISMLLVLDITKYPEIFCPYLLCFKINSPNSPGKDKIISLVLVLDIKKYPKIYNCYLNFKTDSTSSSGQD